MHVVLADTHPESLHTILARMERTFFSPDPTPAAPITAPAAPRSQAPAIQIAIDVEITTATPAIPPPRAEPVSLPPAILLLSAPRLGDQGITAIVPDPLPVADLVEVLPPLADPLAVAKIAEALPAPTITNGFTRPYKNPDLKLVSQNGNGHHAVDKATATVRPELNFAKHADFIFAPAHAKNLHKPRNRPWTETLPDGRKVKASILSEPFRGKVVTTQTYKVLLALQKILEQKGWDEEEKTLFSTRELANVLGVKWAGKKTIKMLYEELDRARFAPLTWQYAFAREDGSLYTLLDRITLLDKLTTLKRELRQKEELFQDLHFFRFSEPIRNNLKDNHTKPINADIALSLKGELSTILYAHFDVILSAKEPYKWQERTTEHLFFDDLKLEGDVEYRYPSGRKRFLQKAVNELNGKPISTGILDLKLAKTADGKDWKLVYRKLPLVVDQLPKPVKIRRVPDANPPEAIPFLINDIETAIGKYPSKHPLFTKLLKTYSADLVYQAISEYRADTRDLPPEKHVREPIAYFQGILHKIVHFNRKDWIKPCETTCKYLPTRSRITPVSKF